MNLHYRPAHPDDAAACIDLRGRTRENAFSAEDLRALGITVESWRDGIRDGALPGVVALADGVMAGYCFGDRDSGEILVLALLPAYEGRGIGRELLGQVMRTLRALGAHGRDRRGRRRSARLPVRLASAPAHAADRRAFAPGLAYAKRAIRKSMNARVRADRSRLLG